MTKISTPNQPNWKHNEHSVHSIHDATILTHTLRKQFLWIKESFVNSKKISLTQRNRFVYIKENFFESIKFCLIQRNLFFDRILKKCCFDSKKMFSGCNPCYTQKKYLMEWKKLFVWNTFFDVKKCFV